MHNEGADINVCDYDGRTALHLAMCNEHLQVIEYIINFSSKSLNSKR